MEMTANFWNPGASGGGDWRSTLLARAPQVVTFVLALALAAQLAFIVVAMTSRSRQAPPPPLAAGAPAAAARHRRRWSTHICSAMRPSRRAAMRRMRRRRACRWCWRESSRRKIPSKAWRSLARAPRRRRLSPSANRCRAAPSCTRCTATAPSSIAAARWNRCSCRGSTGGPDRRAAPPPMPTAAAETATRPCSTACASW